MIGKKNQVKYQLLVFLLYLTKNCYTPACLSFVLITSPPGTEINFNSQPLSCSIFSVYNKTFHENRFRTKQVIIDFSSEISVHMDLCSDHSFLNMAPMQKHRTEHRATAKGISLP